MRFWEAVPSVVAFARDAVADATARVRRVAVVAGDDVAMEVEDGLSGGGAGVHADVVAVGLVMGFDERFGNTNHLIQVRFFFLAQEEEIFFQYIADDKEMTRGNGVLILDDEKIGIPIQNIGIRDIEKDTHLKSFGVFYRWAPLGLDAVGNNVHLLLQKCLAPFGGCSGLQFDRFSQWKLTPDVKFVPGIKPL